MDVWNRAWTSMKATWGKMTLPYRVAFGSLSALLVFLLVFGATQTSPARWVRLVDKEENPEGYAQVLKKLEESRGKNFRVEPDGIYVPPEDQGKLMVEFNDAFGGDLYKTLYGFLGEGNLTSTQWQLQTQKQIADEQVIQATLAKAFRSEIRSITLKISPQSKPSFLGFDGPPATASVVIVTRPGRELTEDNLFAVAGTVANCIPGLKPSNVHITHNGRPYFLPEEGSAAQAASSKRNSEVQIEKSLRDSVMRLYARSPYVHDIGIGCRVVVSGESKEIHERKYDRDGRDVKKRKEEESRKNATGALAVGIKTAGTVDVNEAPGSKTVAEEELTGSDTETVYGSTETRTNRTPGSEEVSKSISLMIGLPGASEAVVAEKNAKEVPQHVTQVSLATGIDPKNVTVWFVPVAAPIELAPPTRWDEASGFLGQYGGTMFLWALAAVALVILYLIVRRSMPKDVFAEIEQMRKRLEPAAEPEVVAEAPPTELEYNRMRAFIKDAVGKNPRNVAGMLRRWIGS